MKNALLTLLLLALTTMRGFTQTGITCTQENPMIWYNTQYELNTLSSTSYVIQWKDHAEYASTPKHNLKSYSKTANTNAPTLLTASINGYNAVNFNNNDYLYCNQANFSASSATTGVQLADGNNGLTDGGWQITIYAVLRFNSGGSNSFLSYPSKTSRSSLTDRIEVNKDKFFWGTDRATSSSSNLLAYNSSIGSSYEIRCIYAKVDPFTGNTIYATYKNGNLTTSSTISSQQQLTSTENISGGIINELILGSVSGTDNVDFDVAEIMIFQVAHDVDLANDRNAVTSYLSLKYGISQEGTTPAYTDFIGNTVWDYTSQCSSEGQYSTYSSRITGLFRADCYGAMHTKSTNVDAGSITNVTYYNTGTSQTDFSNNNEYFLYGDNNGALEFTQSIDYTATLSKTLVALSRMWKVSETSSSVGKVSFEVDLSSAIANTNVASSDIYVIIDSNHDGDLSDETPFQFDTWDATNRIGTFAKDFSTCDVFTVAINSTTPLPVTWLDFTAQDKGNAVQLDWGTGVEINNSHFNIERSTDGTYWEVIGSMSGQGDKQTSTYYTFTDKFPAVGYNYYRIKQVDYDGNYSYSKVEMVVFSNGVLAQSNLYPNPASEKVTIELPYNSTSVEMRITDVSGNVVKFDILNAEKNEVDISMLNKGVYFVELQREKGKMVHRLVVN